jgi:hypothetical protein
MSVLLNNPKKAFCAGKRGLVQKHITRKAAKEESYPLAARPAYKTGGHCNGYCFK